MWKWYSSPKYFLITLLHEDVEYFIRELKEGVANFLSQNSDGPIINQTKINKRSDIDALHNHKEKTMHSRSHV